MNSGTDFSVDVLCSICNTKVGVHVLNTRFGWTKENATPERRGLVDVRCDDCRATHGEFKALCEQASVELAIGLDEAEKLVKKHRKSSLLRVEIDKRKVPPVNSDIIK